MITCKAKHHVLIDNATRKVLSDFESITLKEVDQRNRQLALNKESKRWVTENSLKSSIKKTFLKIKFD